MKATNVTPFCLPRSSAPVAAAQSWGAAACPTATPPSPPATPGGAVAAAVWTNKCGSKRHYGEQGMGILRTQGQRDAWTVPLTREPPCVMWQAAASSGVDSGKQQPAAVTRSLSSRQAAKSRPLFGGADMAWIVASSNQQPCAVAGG
eukprot:366173-Chlamydomonas_euryale.AAC.1